jgi:tetratricopeptide (TPR) repeat protein
MQLKNLVILLIQCMFSFTVLTDEVNSNGGLHICLTFLPENSRVQDQNTGRTSRAGNPGSSQLVLFSEVYEDLTAMTSSRDSANNEVLESSKMENEKVLAKSIIFERFCKLLNTLQNTKKNENRFNFDRIQPEIIREVVKEKFGIWLKTFEEKSEDSVELLSQYNKFEESVIDNAAKGTLTDNPYYFLQSGNKFLKAKNFQQAIKKFSKAIDLEPNFEPFAYLNRAAAYQANSQTFLAINDVTRAKFLLRKRKTDFLNLQNFCDKNSLTESAAKFHRKFWLLNFTEHFVESIGIHMNQSDNASVITFRNWKENIAKSHHESIKKEIVELKKNGWLGFPVMSERSKCAMQ